MRLDGDEAGHVEVHAPLSLKAAPLGSEVGGCTHWL